MVTDDRPPAIRAENLKDPSNPEVTCRFSCFVGVEVSYAKNIDVDPLHVENILVSGSNTIHFPARKGMVKGLDQASM
jgi:hypothetical protein